MLAVLAGFALGQASDHHDPRASKPGVGPRGSMFGVPTGFARTAAGATAALLNYGAALGDPRILLEPARRRQVLSVVATSRYAATFEGRAATALEVTRAGPLGQSLTGGASTIYFATPIAYRVVSYSLDEAVMEGWGVSVIGNDQGLEPQATWGKTLTAMRWVDGSWRIDAVESKDGPVPALAHGQALSSADDFMARLKGLRGVRHAP